MSFMNLAPKRKGKEPAVASISSLTTGSPSPPADDISPPPVDDIPPPIDDSWEAVDISSTEYARIRREVMQLVNDLRSLGGETMMDLPSIVVIGGQSAGKSSLVEAVSGISVPRDSGTCTRCPMECTMSSNATTWSCSVKLRFDYDSFGRPVPPGLQRDIPFVSNVTDKDHMDLWLRRAQAAILNPSISSTIFHKKTMQELKDYTPTNSLKFSRNVVSVFVEDPNATDLSFVDLPGLIQNEDDEVIELVRELTESYINRPNTIILTTIPMTDDIQNQLSVQLARRADPEGERTIGILTKPDMLPDGSITSRRNWLDAIEGRAHILKHGYYCVRLPDDGQRKQGLSRAELQQVAAKFFDETAPWSMVANRKRFGIPGFVSDISVLLVKHIKNAIPGLRQNVERLLDSCLQDISELPKPLDADPQIEVLDRVNAFCDAFRGAVSGVNSKILAQRNRAIFMIFARKIRGTSPDFRPFDNPKRHHRIEVFDVEEREEEDRDFRVKVMGVYDVRKTIAESTAWELPGNVPYEAKIRLIHQFTGLWPRPAKQCLADINDVLDDIVQEFVRTHFGRFKFLRDLITDFMRPDIDACKEATRIAVDRTLEVENSPIFVQNKQDYNELRDKWLNRLRRAHHASKEYWINSPDMKSVGLPGTSPQKAVKLAPPPQRSANYDESQALAHLANAGYKNLTVEDLARLTPRDQFEDELIVMADVRAYFTIACKRFVDHIPLKIHQSLHLSLAEKLSVNLLSHLIADANASGNFADRMKELVSEDPAIGEKRMRLEATKDRLLAMRKKLTTFAVSFVYDDDEPQVPVPPVPFRDFVYDDNDLQAPVPPISLWDFTSESLAPSASFGEFVYDAGQPGSFALSSSFGGSAFDNNEPADPDLAGMKKKKGGASAGGKKKKK